MRIALLGLLIPMTALTHAGEPLRAPRPTEGVPQTFRLQYRFEAGQVLRYELREVSEIIESNSDARQFARNNSSLNKHYRVLEVADDGSTAKLELVVDRIRLRMKVGDEEAIDDETIEPLTFDSASNQAPPKELQSLKQSIGKPVAVATVSNSGELLAMEDRRTGTAQDQNEARHNFLTVLPKEPVAVGASWTHGFDVPLEIAANRKQVFRLKYIFRLEQVRDGIATISFGTTVTPRLTDPSLRARFAQQLPTGTIEFDLGRGVVRSRTERVDRAEIGVAGPRTSLVVVSERVERLVDPDAAVSQSDR